MESGGNVENGNNKRNGLVVRVCGVLVDIVRMLSEKKSEWHFFRIAEVRSRTCGEPRFSVLSLKSR